MVTAKIDPQELPPHNDDAERAVAGVLITDTDAVIDECVRVTKGISEFFFDLRNRYVIEAILAISAEGKPVDIISVKTRLDQMYRMEKVGSDYIMSLINDAPPPSGITYWLEILRENYMARRLMNECATTRSEVTAANAMEALAGHTQRILAIGDTTTDAQCTSGIPLTHSLLDYLEARRARHESGKATGIVSGWLDLDKFTDGFQFAEQAIIGARPSIGKTALACGIACQACLKDKVPTLVVTLEMSKEAILNRMLSAHNNVPMQTLRWGKFDQQSYKRVVGFTSIMAASPLYFVQASTRGLSSLQIAAEIRRHVRRHGIKLVLIDYLQKIKPTEKHEKRTYEIGEVSGTLRAVAQQTGVAMVTLAQLNREPEKDKGRAPRLADLADSGQIERDADLVILVDRNRAEKVGEARLIIAKQRDGETGVANVVFNGVFCRFENQAKVSNDDVPSQQPHND